MLMNKVSPKRDTPRNSARLHNSSADDDDGFGSENLESMSGDTENLRRSACESK